MSYIYLDRSLAEHDVWLSEPFTKGQAWVDLLMLANHTDSIVTIRGIEVEVKRGQVLAGGYFLANRWKWSRNKVRRYIDSLRRRQMVNHQKNNVCGIISIINYDARQKKRVTKRTTRRTPEGHTKVITSKEQVKNHKPLSGKPDDNGLDRKIDEVITALNRRCGKNYRTKTEANRTHIGARLKDGFSVDELKRVIGVKAQEWKGTEYDKFLRPATLFCPKNFESYLNQQPEEAIKPKTKDDGRYVVEL